MGLEKSKECQVVEREFDQVRCDRCGYVETFPNLSSLKDYDQFRAHWLILHVDYRRAWAAKTYCKANGCDVFVLETLEGLKADDSQVS